jgi:transcriptional regulator with XRE-family HTH domain
MGENYVSTIARLRKAKGLTQRQVADALDVDVSSVRNWEKSRDGVNMFVRVAKLCRLLDCSAEDLYEDETLTEVE